MLKSLRKKIKEKTPSEFKRFFGFMVVGMFFLDIVIGSESDMVFSVGFAILFYVGCNILIRNFSKTENKEIYYDMSDIALFSTAVIYVIKVVVVPFLGKYNEYEFSRVVITFFLLYAIALLIFTFIVYLLNENGKKNHTHWSTHEQEKDK